MILSDREIRRLISCGELVISPDYEDIQIQPASFDFRLGDSFVVPELGFLQEYATFNEGNNFSEYRHQSKYLLEPKGFVLATTVEYFKLPNNLTAFVEGRSSIGRMGLFIQNAGWVDPGFEGEITLELFNASNNPIMLTSGSRVGQLVFAKMDSPAINPYRGKYQHQRGATHSLIHLDKDRVPNY